MILSGSPQVGTIDFRCSYTHSDASRPGPRPDSFTGVDRTPKEELDFIRAQAPKAKYILSVCSGALQLALAGVLAGKRATTNKVFYRVITVRPARCYLRRLFVESP
jgi:transcriptional regulator GlxA family with amidase domain